MNQKLPALKAKDVVAVLLSAGFELIRQKGSHKILGHPDRPELRVVVPDHGSRDLKTGTLRKILEQADMTADDFRALL